MAGLNVSGPVESVIIAGRRFECGADDSGEIALSGLKNEVKRSGAGGKRLVTDGVKLIYKVSERSPQAGDTPAMPRFTIFSN
jgi:hypothetical protein